MENLLKPVELKNTFIALIVFNTKRKTFKRRTLVRMKIDAQNMINNLRYDFTSFHFLGHILAFVM